MQDSSLRPCVYAPILKSPYTPKVILACCWKLCNTVFADYYVIAMS